MSTRVLTTTYSYEVNLNMLERPFYDVIVVGESNDIYVRAVTKACQVCMFRYVRKEHIDKKDKVILRYEIRINSEDVITAEFGVYYGEKGFGKFITAIQNAVQTNHNPICPHDTDGFIKLFYSSNAYMGYVHRGGYVRHGRNIHPGMFNERRSDSTIDAYGVLKNDEAAIAAINAIALLSDRVNIHYYEGTDPAYFYGYSSEFSIVKPKDMA